MSLSTSPAAAFVTTANDAEVQAMRYVDYAAHPASSDRTVDTALDVALDSAIRAGAYRAGARGQIDRMDIYIAVI